MMLEVITGPMFAGKTSELIRRVRRARIAGESVRVFTPDMGDGNDRYITTHTDRTIEAEVIGSADEIAGLDGTDVVAVDEAQFFDESIVDVLRPQFTSDSSRVVVAGTDQTFRKEPWEPMPTFMALADSVDKLTAVCVKCGGEATCNQRLVDGAPAPADMKTVDVGSVDKYEARCRRCHELR